MRNYLIQFIKLGLCFAIAYFVSLFSMEYIITNPDENTMLIVFYGTVCCLILGESLRSNDRKDWYYGIARRSIMRSTIPKFDKNHVQYVHDQDKTVIGFDIAMGSYQLAGANVGELIDIDVEGFIYRCLVHKINKIGKNYIYNLRWINERRKSNN